MSSICSFDRWKQPAQLASPSSPPPPPGTLLNVTGWGTLRERGEFSKQLRWASVPLVAKADCRRAYRNVSLAAKVLPGMLCAGERRQINFIADRSCHLLIDMTIVTFRLA